jgi:hypothetical protein
MEGISFGSIFSIGALVFCIVIWMATLLLRRIIEAIAGKVKYIFPDKYEPFWVELWREKLLPNLPIGVGGLMAWLVEVYPYPPPFDDSISGRIFFGLVAGLASGHVYRFFKRFLPNGAKDKVQELEEKIAGKLPDDEEEEKEEEGDENIEE